MVCRSFNFGIGALAYLRRVVENSLNALLDLAAEAERTNGIPVDDLSLARAKETLTYAEKAEFAQQHLPDRVKRAGHNPFDILCRFASGGVHAGGESECSEIFDRIRILFELLYRDLRMEIKDGSTLRKVMGELSRSMGQRSTRDHVSTEMKARDRDIEL